MNPVPSNSTSGRRWVYFFGDTLPAEMDPKEWLGGKGASLAEMGRAGLRVPPGFTITTEACRFFHDKNGQWPAELEEQIRENLKRLEAATGRTFGRGPKPLLVSVRSGAAVSMPGMMDTILNCGLHPGLAGEFEANQFEQAYAQFIERFAEIVHDVALKIPSAPAAAQEISIPTRRFQDCLAAYARQTGTPFPLDPWALLVACINAVFRSWNSERAIAYRRHRRLAGLAGTAVNVQAMFPSQLSGILFTHDPNNYGARRMIVEAAPGLGEMVVSGEVTPDRFLVRCDDFSRFEFQPGQRGRALVALGPAQISAPPGAPVLDPQQIAELCELALRIEKHFGKPMDIEWGWAEGEFAMLQCRPIRGADIMLEAESCRSDEIRRLRELAKTGRRTWVAHNLGETLRFPTPLTWDIIRHFMSGRGGFGQMYRDFGYQPSLEICERGFLELICGRIYADPDRLAQLFWAGLPLSYDLDAMRAAPAALNNAPTKLDPDKADAELLLRLPKLLRAMLRCSRNLKKLRRDVRRHFEETILPPYLEYIRGKRRQDLTSLSFSELLRELQERRTRVLDQFGKESLKPGFFGGLALGELETLLKQLLGAAKGAQLAATLVSALEGDTTLEQNDLLARVARKQAALAEFLEKFGHRAPNEMELMEPRWREDPAALQSVLQQVAAAQIRQPAGAEYKSALAELPATLEQSGGSSFFEEIDLQLSAARALLPCRESGKHYLMMGYELIRGVILGLGRRTGLGSDIFFLQLDELEGLAKGEPISAQTIQKRKLRWQAQQKIYLPEVIDSADLDNLGRPPAVVASGELKAEPVSSGVATGQAQIVFQPAEAAGLGAGYILVCPSTDPGWTPLLINARALVVERGGVLSHGAIVARDFGIPAVVCPTATSLLRSGELIRVDGNSGLIARLKEEDHA